MSSLSDNEKRYLEKLLGMQSGYVLDYSDATYGEFFARHGISIHDRRYQKYGTSKAKKMRAFWELESDLKVGRVLTEMLDSYVTDCELSGSPPNEAILTRCREIVSRLLGHKQKQPEKSEDLDSFLDKEFEIPNIHKLPVEDQVVQIIENRLKEARASLKVNANLAVIFLCGSVLEGVLLGAAQRAPADFNRSSASPRDATGKVKPFHDWTLAQLIDVASDLEIIGLDVKKFSHGLRDFRNYIHPYEQMISGFSPDKHTARVCFQVLKAALADIAGER